MLRWQKENSIPIEKAANMPKEALKDKIVTGVFIDRIAPEFSAEYEKVRQRAKAGDKS